MTNYVLIGDIHSQYEKLKLAIDFIQKNIPNYKIIFLGDLFDSRNNYSNSTEVYKTIRELITKNLSIVLQSNHQDKFLRYLKGNNVSIDGGLEKTIEDFNNSEISLQEVQEWLASLPYGICFRDKQNLEYRCSHAYFSSKLLVPLDYEDEYFIYEVSNQTKDKCLYGPNLRENGKRIRLEWWNDSSERNWMRVAGHYHTCYVNYNNKSLVLDGGCGCPSGNLLVYNVNERELYDF